MTRNFDCTQFITFDSLKVNDIDRFISMLFKDSPFKSVTKLEISDVKKEYFHYEFSTYTYELQFEEFIGELEEWADINQPTDSILIFNNLLQKILEKYPENFKVILTVFAEEGEDSKDVIDVTPDTVLLGLFSLSKYNFDIWPDNLVISLT